MLVDIFFLHLLFFFNDTATTEIYTLSLHDALPISKGGHDGDGPAPPPRRASRRSEEHTSELQSRRDLVCRLLLEKKKKMKNTTLFEKIENKKHYTKNTLSHK